VGSVTEPAGGSLGDRFSGGPTAVALTGACTYVGTELIRRLDADPRCQRIVALDVRAPDVTCEKLDFAKVDLTVPTVAGVLADRLRGVDAVVHGAFLSFPTHASAWAHELEDVGTMHVLDACTQARPRQLVLASTTLVYGPSPRNPNWLTEDAPLAGLPGSRFIGDKVRAEEQVRHFAGANPGTRVAVLRFAPVIGPTVVNYFTRFFSRPIAPRLMGRDPLLQFVHERDAVAALGRVLDLGAAGVFNIVGDGVLPYSTVLAMMGRVPLPMPHFVAARLVRAMWTAQVGGAPPPFLDFLRYLCVADGGKARRELGFRPRHDIRRTILDFLGLEGEDSELDVARAQG
jgi:UDP-glucose 4-epimerase